MNFGYIFTGGQKASSSGWVVFWDTKLENGIDDFRAGPEALARTNEAQRTSITSRG